MQAVVDAGAVAYLAPLIISQDAKLKRQVCCSLSQIAKHSVDLAEVVVGAEIFPKILTCLKFPDEFVKVREAIFLIRINIFTMCASTETRCYGRS